MTSTIPSSSSMDLWLTERHEDQTGITVKVKQALYHGKSDYQTIDIVETDVYGRVLLLDGMFMVTEKDEFIYHELITHIPLLSHPNPRKVLVIGGGDGGTVREVLRHPSVEKVTLCEIDELVIQACRTYLPSMAGDLSDERVDVQVADGVAFIAKYRQEFDVILIDSTDPLGPGEGLFTETFYQNVYDALTESGIMAAQSESPIADQREIQLIYPLLRKVFPVVMPYVGPIPTYPSGYWSWAFCSKGRDPFSLIQEGCARYEAACELEQSTLYYNRALHHAAFLVPNFVKHLTGSLTHLPIQVSCDTSAGLPVSC